MRSRRSIFLKNDKKDRRRHIGFYLHLAEDLPKTSSMFLLLFKEGIFWTAVKKKQENV